MTGVIHGKNTMFLRQGIATISENDVPAYEVSILMNGMPHIRNIETGRQWIISLEALLALARDAGIDNKEVHNGT